MKKIELRKQQKKLRKNFLPTLLITLLLWFVLFLFVYFIDPHAFAAVPAFFIIFFIAALFTASTVFTNTKRGFIVAFFVTIFLILRYFDIGSLFNLLLLFGIAIALDTYLSRH